jgi:hypothetical protein
MSVKDILDRVLSGKDILDADDILIEKVPVPEWGGSVCVKGMTGQERDKYEGDIIKSSAGKKPGSAEYNLENMRAKLCSMTACDEDGKRLFSERDVRKLGAKSASALQRVFEVAQKLSGITDEDIESLAEGLEEDPFDDSVTDLPSLSEE